MGVTVEPTRVSCSHSGGRHREHLDIDGQRTRPIVSCVRDCIGCPRNSKGPTEGHASADTNGATAPAEAQSTPRRSGATPTAPANPALRFNPPRPLNSGATKPTSNRTRGFNARWLAGVAVSLSEGDGDYHLLEGDDSGRVESTLTTFYPYAKLSLNDKVDVWGLRCAATPSASPARLHNASGSDCPTPCAGSKLRREGPTQVPKRCRGESHRAPICSDKDFLR